ncbi:HAMP domain-containing sensor histidine kinase [Fluviicola taffensis]|uniref:histidine kinase n=1 Tax=Fluviicola taffensis (strain DSM 16823 / NCIMB 13979 / RW262) TaxID=755732 RepID=F2IFU6_FLUTR|nr:ATP-binding protein [Fluviicola taffensis]AEA42554.1 PAS/PAC sensor signal transduction histidine kinase [Fluviicola taffensis DSM 16823]
MKIKTKLTLGVGLLLLLIILLAVVSAGYVLALKEDTNNILVANYNSLDYSRKMLLAIDEEENDKTAEKRFRENLALQNKNITETGEREIMERLNDHVRQMGNNFTVKTQIHQLVRQDLLEIMRLNMSAIQRKSDFANQSTNSALFWIVGTGSACFLIAFILLVQLPRNIARPIKELTESIRQIASRNYKQRVAFESHNEFGDLAKSFNIMAEKLDEYNSTQLAEVLYEKKRIETLINSMNDPVIGLDENNLIMFVNDKAINILGLSKTDLMGKSAQEVALSNDLLRSLIRTSIDSTDKEGKHAAPIRIFVNDKEQYFEKEQVTISITPTGESEKHTIGDVIILRNITSFKELEFAKTNFMATISHELKTPISSIKMSLQLLEKEAGGIVNPEQLQLIHSIKEDSDRLLKITGELLNLSQIETGNIQLVLQSSSPHDMVSHAVEAATKEAERYQVNIQVNEAEKISEIFVDMDKTQWVLINLLVNAIHYSPIGGTVTVSLEQQGTSVRFAVSDKGKGIDPKYTTRIFDRYFQVPGSSKSGSGLGLAICREFIEAQGGTIDVDSQLGEGSTFYFLIEQK